MPDRIVCEVCGESNPTDAEFCENCKSRLQPLTGPLRGENVPIQPGQVPTKKVTSEPESVLPKWLREARQQERQSVEEETSKADQEQEPAPVNQGPNLLAGLVSQGQWEDEETPDWVTSLKGTPTKQGKPEPGETQAKWMELGHGDEPAAAPSVENAIVPPQADPGKGSSDADELTEWFKRASDISASASSDKTGNDQSSQTGNDSFPAFKGGDLDWLKRLDAEPSISEQSATQPAPTAREVTPNWLQKLDHSTRDAGADVAGTSSASDQGIEPPSPKEENITSQANLPAWLKNISEDLRATTNSKPAASDQILRDWLQAPGASTAVQATEPFESVLEEGAAPGELSDWIASSSPVEPQTCIPAKPAVATFKPLEPPSESAPEASPPAASAFTADSMTGSDVEAIFASMKTPDWLSEITASHSPSEASAENVPPAAQAEVPIAPTELPSWVQAMRPVESAMPNSPVGVTDSRLDEDGALAGLHGVLPAIPGAAISPSKPKSHPIKLDATEHQQAHAALLEKILAAETSPIPMKTAVAPRSQRALRWAISAFLFVVLGAVVFTGTQDFPLPGGVPSETITAIRTIEAIPADAPVLVVFDYEPSTVGEMEATAASLMDHLLLLKHPRLALLSTSPTGAALAERFISSTLASRTYQRGVQYENLGYLPGGLAGVYDFAQNPPTAMPLGADSAAVWQSPVLRGVAHLADFAAIIVLTDSVDSGRVWIEQTALTRGSAPIVMAASAQAGPMLLPYVDSGQLSGLITGLNGAAGAEQANGGLPGYIRSYWDAYSVGLLLAAVLILMGGIWNFWLGTRDRRAQEVA